MANTYTQIYIHIVLPVKEWKKNIRIEFQEELHEYITGIIQNQNHKLLAINSTSNHIHIFCQINPKIIISDFVRDIKSNSSRYINRKKWLKEKFQWQEGFGVFSYSHSQLDSMIKFIQNQEKYHQQRSFKDEYINLLRKFDIEYDTRFIFD